jgi:cephalosporin hydroxylase
MKLAPPMVNVKMYPYTRSKNPAVQVDYELKSFLAFIEKKQISNYLEIGSAHGDTFFEVVKRLPAGSKAVAIDFPEKSWGLSGSQKNLIKACGELKGMGYDVSFCFGDSKDQGIIDLVKADYDMVFIDGDHTYEGVKADWLNYGKMGKYVAFHDIVDSELPNLDGEIIKVPSFWNELKKQYMNYEFVDKGSTMGIGVLCM